MSERLFCAVPRQPSHSPCVDSPSTSVQVPGQFVGVRLPGQAESSGDGGSSSSKGLSDNKQLYAIACSPYESRRDSAYISGSIIEVSSQLKQCLEAQPAGDVRYTRSNRADVPLMDAAEALTVLLRVTCTHGTHGNATFTLYSCYCPAGLIGWFSQCCLVPASVTSST